MNGINTVLGLISPDSLGLTLVHEHIVAAYPGWECDPLARPYDRARMVEVCTCNLKPVKSYGVTTIIDATPVDLNRDVDVMKEVSEKLEINIICSTGRYSEEEGKWAYLKQRSRSGVGDMKTELYESFMSEITQGIGRSGAKPGVIKIATGPNSISPCEEAALRAAARACKETGIPIITHTQDGTMGPEQVELLAGEGVDPLRVLIGHMCGNSSLEYKEAVLSKGANIAFDRFGLEKFMPDETRVAMLVELLGMGYADHVMISQDFIGCTLGRKTVWPKEALRLYANWSYVNVFLNIIPALKDAGITDEQIRTMMVYNPRSLLAGA